MWSPTPCATAPLESSTGHLATTLKAALPAGYTGTNYMPINPLSVGQWIGIALGSSVLIGALMSLATNSLLNLCAPHGWDDVAAPDTSSGAEPAPLVCTGVEAGAAHDQSHRLLLRTPIASSRFAVERVAS